MAPGEAASDHPKCPTCGFHHPKFGAELHQRCDVCGRTFPSKIGLEFHRRSHKGS